MEAASRNRAVGPSPHTSSTTLDQVFGGHGLLAESIEGYQPRKSQIEMAKACAKALREGTHLLVEAPTGTGKSFAYLVPAILHAAPSAMRVLVATANIALQEQLATKDLPRLRKLLQVPFRYALIKGRGNYLCLDKLEEHRHKLFANVIHPEDQEQFDCILGWSEGTATGDRSELPFTPTARVWKHFSVSDTSECAGCELPCFHRAVMQAAEEADILVCNYHLLFADLKVRSATGGATGLLPSYDILIADEAHEAPEICASFAGVECGRWTFRPLRKFLSDALYHQLDGAAHRFARSLRVAKFLEDNAVRITQPGCVDASELIHFIQCARQYLKEEARQEKDETSRRYQQLKKRRQWCYEIIQTLNLLIDQEEPEWAYWIETAPSKTGEVYGKLCGKPVHVAAYLEERLYPYLHSFIGTSATLTTTRNDFSFTTKRLGLRSAEHLVLPSPFDFDTRALMVIPDHLPEPNSAGFRDCVTQVLHDAVLGAGGRTLLLFTSSQALKASWDALMPELQRAGIHGLRQGTVPPTQLIQEFQTDISSVLFATRTFFQGIDVPGEALSMVTLDRLPFPSPADPVMDWIATHDPKGWFAHHSLPLALITFKQIFGRLIRRWDDRGVILLLDGRIESKRYGRQFLRSLPGGRRTNDLSAICGFLDRNDDPLV